MHRGHVMFAVLALAFADAIAFAARFEGQFDLVCEGNISKDGTAWAPRFSVDIGRGLFCTRKVGDCVQKAPREIFQVTPSSLVLVDDPPTESTVRTVLSVSSATDEAKFERHERNGSITLFATAACKRTAFTPFPLIPTP